MDVHKQTYIPLTVSFYLHRITSYYIDQTDAGLKGLYIREITLKYEYTTLGIATTVSDAMEICFVSIYFILIRPKLV